MGPTQSEGGFVAGTIVVTGCDAAHFGLASELLASLGHAAPKREFSIGFVNVGAGVLPDQIQAGVDIVFPLADTGFIDEGRRGFRVAYLAVKARLPEFFPGFDTYVWLDGDTWVQNAVGIEQIAHCAQLADFAVHPELDANYFAEPIPSTRTLWAYPSIYGEDEARKQITTPMVNGGVFGARAGSPLWSAWHEALRELTSRAEGRAEFYFSDQIPLHRLIALKRLSIYPLRALNNWMIHAARPAVDFKRRRLLAPTFPHEEINIIHLTGTTKAARYKLGDGDEEISFRYQAVLALFDRHDPLVSSTQASS